MNCKKSLRLIGPFMDGELGEAESSRLREHLEVCPGCSQRLELLRGMTRSISTLPEIKPTPEESYRLMNRLRGEMSAPPVPKPAFGRAWATAAALFLVAAVSFAVAWSVLGNMSTTTTKVVTPAVEEEASRGTAAVPGESAPTASTLSAITPPSSVVTQPTLVVSNKEYSPAELSDFRNDLGARMDFYSSYWYPAAAGNGALSTKELQNQITETLAQQAQAAGKNPDDVKRAVETALAQAGNAALLPCYVEQAKVEGKDAWLVSLSCPEDYLLFPNPQIPPAMNLASRGGASGLKISESLLRQLAAMLPPHSTSTTTAVAREEQVSSREQAGTQTSPLTEQVTADQSLEKPLEAALAPAQQQEFQAFLRQLAAQGTSYDLIEALRGLNYQQLLMLVQGNWSALAAGGVDLTEFLTPPKNLMAIDTATSTVIWKP
jgi:hypothetical protein